MLYGVWVGRKGDGAVEDSEGGKESWRLRRGKYGKGSWQKCWESRGAASPLRRSSTEAGGQKQTLSGVAQIADVRDTCAGLDLERR